MSADDVAKTDTARNKRRKGNEKNASKKRQDKGRTRSGGPSPPAPVSSSTGDGNRPWWRRGWALVTGGILALGALASAITAILGLVWPEQDLVDKAEITSIDLIAAVPLSEYARRAQSGPAALGGRTTPDLALVGYATYPSDSAPAAGIADVGSTQLPTEEPTEPPTEGPATPSTEPPSDSPSGSPTESPSESPTESPSESPTEAPTESPSEAPTDDLPSAPPAIDVEMLHYEDVLAEAGSVAPEFELPGPDGSPSQPMFALISTMKDDAGEPVPVAEAARRLVSVLGHTRTVQTENGTRDPLGVIVTANMQLEGLLGRQLGVYWEVWSQGGVSRLYDRWLDEVPVARIVAEREKDTGAVQFWVPMPKSRGTYVIHVIIKDGDKLLSVGRSDLFE